MIRNQNASGGDLMKMMAMADYLADILKEYGSIKKSFTMKDWSRYIEIAYITIMELQLIQFEEHAGKIKSSISISIIVISEF